MPNQVNYAGHRIRSASAGRCAGPVRSGIFRRLAALATVLLICLTVSRASADACVAGRGQVCQTNGDCAGTASACLHGTCQVPCGKVPNGSQSEVPQQNLCSVGEACQAVQNGSQTRYACKSVPF